MNLVHRAAAAAFLVLPVVAVPAHADDMGELEAAQKP